MKNSLFASVTKPRAARYLRDSWCWDNTRMGGVLKSRNSWSIIVMKFLKCKRGLSLLLVVYVLGVLPDAMHAAGTVQPGGTLVLKAGTAPDPDGRFVEGEVFSFATTNTSTSGIRYGARSTAVSHFGKGKAKVVEFYDFSIESGAGSPTVLHAQIAGRAKLNGFIALVGEGMVKGNLNLKVIDLGRTDSPLPNGGRVIHDKELAKHEIKGVVFTGVGFDVKVEGGAPYIGFGGGPAFKFDVKLEKELVRDDLEFGFHILLRRGHSYRVQFELDVLAKKGLLQGLAIAQFNPLFFDSVPDMLDPNHWKDSLAEMIDTALPNIKPEGMYLKKGGILPDLFKDREMIEDAIDFANTAQLLTQRADGADLPKSFLEIISQRVLPGSGDLEEGINFPGVEVQDLLVTVETDQVELLREIKNLLVTPQGRRPGFPLKQ